MKNFVLNYRLYTLNIVIFCVFFSKFIIICQHEDGKLKTFYKFILLNVWVYAQNINAFKSCSCLFLFYVFNTPEQHNSKCNSSSIRNTTVIHGTFTWYLTVCLFVCLMSMTSVCLQTNVRVLWKIMYELGVNEIKTNSSNNFSCFGWKLRKFSREFKWELSIAHIFVFFF